MKPDVPGNRQAASPALSQFITRLARPALLGQCVALALALDAVETSGVPAASGEDFARARTELHRAVQEGRIAGGAHLVVRDGKTLYSEAAGVGDIEEPTPFTADSILRIYSMTKPITSVAAMMLFEQGKFGLDDPVAQFIPAFANTTVLEIVDGKTRQVPPKRPITVRDVFRHTTGYSYGDEPSVREYYEREGLRYRGPQGLFPPKMTVARAAEALARIPALHHPGEKYTYGFNTDLLGRLIEVWSGEPLDRYLQRAVFEPIEMTDTGFSVPMEKRSRFASCHIVRDGELAVLDPAATSPFNDGFEFLSGGGGLVSTVQDYANFCQMLVDGGSFKERRLLKPETLRLMFTDQLRGVDGGNRFGLGFGIDDVTLGSGAGQRKAAGYRWGGYASTQFAVVPDERLFQIFALQQVPYTEELARHQFAIVYAGFTSPSIPSASSAGDGSAHWPQFRGPGAAGLSVNTGLPDTWSATANAAWKTDLPGRSCLEYQLGRVDAAMELFLGLLALPADEPDLVEVIDKAGDFLLDQKDFENALKLYDTAVDRRAETAVFWSGFGYCLGRLGRKTEAVGAARRAVALEPSSALRLNDLGWALLEADSYAEARSILEQAVALAPADYELPRANLLHLEERLKRKHGSRKVKQE